MPITWSELPPSLAFHLGLLQLVLPEADPIASSRPRIPGRTSEPPWRRQRHPSLE
ncbi:hypothetical protein [Streptomyces sp. NPDC097619]|uniref:hypothetical protein n=1 Tax=Streptomyces sp. NPDC097619 TaxID=3157228 RepID=UPI00332447D1